MSLAGRILKPAGGSTWNPEITFTEAVPGVALLVTTILATRCVGPRTHTRRTEISLVPNPRVTWPLMKLVLVVVMSISEAVPTARAGGVTPVICGSLAAGEEETTGLR